MTTVDKVLLPILAVTALGSWIAVQAVRCAPTVQTVKVDCKVESHASDGSVHLDCRPTVQGAPSADGRIQVELPADALPAPKPNETTGAWLGRITADQARQN